MTRAVLVVAAAVLTATVAGWALLALAAVLLVGHRTRRAAA